MGCSHVLCTYNWALALLQVSELSHKLGSAQGAQQSLEQEVAELREKVKALAADKHNSEVAASETKAKLMAAEDKVGGNRGGFSGSMQYSTFAAEVVQVQQAQNQRVIQGTMRGEVITVSTADT